MELRLQKKQMIFVLFLIGLFVIGCSSTKVEETGQADTNEPADDMGMEETDDTMDDHMEDDMPKMPADEPIVTFTLTGMNFKFMMNGEENPDLHVKQGDRVRIVFSATEGFHDWVVDEFHAATQRVRNGDPTTVEFIADKKGTFSYYCSVGSHKQQGMEGSLIVE